MLLPQMHHYNSLLAAANLPHHQREQLSKSRDNFTNQIKKENSAFSAVAKHSPPNSPTNSEDKPSDTSSGSLEPPTSEKLKFDFAHMASSAAQNAAAAAAASSAP